MDIVTLAWITGGALVAALMGYHHLMDGVPLRSHRAQLRGRLSRRLISSVALALGVLCANLLLIALTVSAAT